MACSDLKDHNFCQTSNIKYEKRRFMKRKDKDICWKMLIESIVVADGGTSKREKGIIFRMIYHYIQ